MEFLNLIRSYPHGSKEKSHMSLDKVVDIRYHSYNPSTHYEVVYLEWDGVEEAYMAHSTEFFSLDNLSGAIRCLSERAASYYPARESSNRWENRLENVAIKA
jgi:hypothetical protein